MDIWHTLSTRGQLCTCMCCKVVLLLQALTRTWSPVTALPNWGLDHFTVPQISCRHSTVHPCVRLLHMSVWLCWLCVCLQVMSTQGCWTVPAVCWTTACLSCSSSCRTRQGKPSQHRVAADCGRLHVGCTLAYVWLHPLRGGVGSRTCTSAVAHVSRRRCGC